MTRDPRPATRATPRPKQWALAALGVVAVTIVGVLATRPPDLARRSQALEIEVGRQLARAGVRSARLVHEARTLRRVRGRRYHVVEKTYRVPDRFSVDAFARDAARAVAPLGCELLRSQRAQPEGPRVAVLEFGSRGYLLYRVTLREPAAPVAAAPPPLPLPRGRGKIAIVLDDWGYSRRLVPEVLQLNRPITLAVLPHHPYSKAVAEAVQGSRCEVILHLPMEPHDAASPREPHVLTPGMSADAVRALVDQALATVPYARGVSNHQGSRATEDAALMRVLLQDLRQRRLLFLDSMVTDRSAGLGVARKLRLPFAQRSVFLDNEGTPQAVRRQLIELAEVAIRMGEAVGIGHDKRVTIEVLRELMPQLEAQGLEFVRLSDLARAP